MAGERKVRAERAYAQAFSEVLRELKKPPPALCSVVRVDMSPDLRSARVYLSMYGDRMAEATSRRMLDNARVWLQGEAGRRVGLRFTPHLSIVADRSISEVVRLGGLLDAAGEGERPGDTGHGGGPGRPPAR